MPGLLPKTSTFQAMNPQNPSTDPASLDLTRFAHATRFALACVVFGISGFAVNGCLTIPKFARIFADMLGQNEPLPALTQLILGMSWPLLALSVSIPATAMVLLFTRNIVRSIYGLGALVLISMVLSAVVSHATYTPLTTILVKMQAAP